MFDIQLAIDQAQAGDTIIVPSGIYDLTKNPDIAFYAGGWWNYAAIKINKPLTLILDGVLIRTKTLDYTSGSAYGVFWVIGTQEVHIKGGYLIGDVMPTDGKISSRIGVMIQDSHHCSVDRLHTKNFSQGINVYKSHYNTITNSDCEYNIGSGIILNLSSYNYIGGCTVKNSSDGCISLYGDGVGHHNFAENNEIMENRPGVSGEQGITIENEKHSTARHNIIRGMYYGIDIKNGCDDILVEYNEVHDYVHGIALRNGDGGDNGVLKSNDIKVQYNLGLTPRYKADGSVVWPNSAIFVGPGSGANHLVTKNIVKSGRIVAAAKEISYDFTYDVFEVVDGVPVCIGQNKVIENFYT